MTITKKESSSSKLVTSVDAQKILWIGVAVSFFTYAAAFLKLTLAGRLNLTLPHILTLLIAGLALASAMAGRNVIRMPVIEKIPGRLIAISMLGVVLLHLIGTVRAYDEFVALRETIKIAIGFVTFWCIVATYPDDRDFEEKFWIIIMGFSTVAVLILMYRYYFIFHSPFLGNTWGVRVRGGRNLLGWYLAIMSSISYAGALLSRQRIFMSVTTSVIVVACLYTGSRSSIGLMSAGIVIVSTLALAYRHTRRAAMVGIGTGATVIGGLVIYNWSTVMELVENSEFYLRVIDLVASGGSGAGLRIHLIERAWNCFKEGPLLFGRGVKNVIICIGQDTAVNQEISVHNDYLTILADLGLVGLFLYLAIIFSILYIVTRRLILRAASVTWIDIGLFAAAVLSMVYLNATTGYNSPLLWSVFGFAVVSSKAIGTVARQREV